MTDCKRSPNPPKPHALSCQDCGEYPVEVHSVRTERLNKYGLVDSVHRTQCGACCPVCGEKKA